MYFSRIKVCAGAPESPPFWSAFRSVYQLHKAVWDLFGDHPDRKRDFLYHVKEDSGSPVVYAVSVRPPAKVSDLWEMETKVFDPRLRAGMMLGFQLRANPVRTRDGKRHDVVMEEKCRLKKNCKPRSEWPLEAELVQATGERWLSERSGKSGIRLHSVRADGYRQHDFSKSAGANKHVRLSSVDFTGHLEVIEPAVFRDALFSGFGPAKGFGCGLMLIRPA